MIRIPKILATGRNIYWFPKVCPSCTQPTGFDYVGNAGTGSNRQTYLSKYFKCTNCGVMHKFEWGLVGVSKLVETVADFH